MFLIGPRVEINHSPGPSGQIIRELSYAVCSHFPLAHKGSNERSDDERGGRNFIFFFLPKLLAKLLQRQGQAAHSVICTLSQPRAPQCRTGTSKIDFSTLLPYVTTKRDTSGKLVDGGTHLKKK